jgi:hypothetical protein
MWDKGWDKIFSTAEWGKYPGEELIRFIARNFYAAPSKDMDVGLVQTYGFYQGKVLTHLE